MIDKIKELLGEELSKQVAEKLGDVELAIFNDGSVVPADKYDTLKGTHKALEQKYATDIADFNKKLETASKDVGDVEAIKANLAKMQEENQSLMDKYKADTLNIKLDSKIDVALLKANADSQYIPMLKTQINKDTLSFEGEDVIGLTDTINKLQADFPKMFGEVKKAGQQPDGDHKKAPLGEKAKLMEAYDNAKSFADKLAIQRKIQALKE